jgi:hypothetical protein
VVFYLVGTRAREQTVAVSLESGEMALEEGIVGAVA